mmetsp:Transcript_9983/g.33890  ORF Transcript_9983/g.33890 Transcript_9983/m.33890 type:complete len:265 (-) Transcript_9983:1033-1827(-)
MPHARWAEVGRAAVRDGEGGEVCGWDTVQGEPRRMPKEKMPSAAHPAAPPQLPARVERQSSMTAVQPAGACRGSSPSQAPNRSEVQSELMEPALEVGVIVGDRAGWDARSSSSSSSSRAASPWPEKAVGARQVGQERCCSSHALRQAEWKMCPQHRRRGRPRVAAMRPSSPLRRPSPSSAVRRSRHTAQWSSKARSSPGEATGHRRTSAARSQNLLCAVSRAASATTSAYTFTDRKRSSRVPQRPLMSHVCACWSTTAEAQSTS